MERLRGKEEQKDMGLWRCGLRLNILYFNSMLPQMLIMDNISLVVDHKVRSFNSFFQDVV